MRGDTIGDLARQIDVPADELAHTIRASTSSRPRASTPTSAAASRRTTTASAIPGIGPTPRSGRLDRAPYYATRVLPADVGTCGGVITDEHAQVLDEQDRVIDGLYATGNITATVMGRTYLGAGGSIANTMVFGYVAARHAAGRRVAGEMSA